MKKIISTILCVSLLALIICIPVSATEEVVVSESIEEFCEDVNEMVTEYSDSEFVTPDFIEDKQTSENTVEEIEINYCPRLIVQSDKPIDTYNAVDVVSGFFNFYIVQFENETDTNYAYEQYKHNANIISVEYDISYNGFQETVAETTQSTQLTFSDHKNDWSLTATGMDIVLNEYKDCNLPEVIVAVIDTGFDFNCKYYENRIIPTNFNNSGEDDENSEQDYYGHGTQVTSVIANCTTDNVKIANYRCGTRTGQITPVSVCSAIIYAIEKKAKIINCSFSIVGNEELVESTLKYAYDNKVLITSAAGNRVGNLSYNNCAPINTSPTVLSIGSSSKYNLPSGFTGYGTPVDILAPGENICLIGLNNEILLSSGTSFSAPFIASVYAMYYSTHPTVAFTDILNAIKGSGMLTDEKYVTDFFGGGIIDANELFEFNTIKQPDFSLEEGKYIGRVSIEFYAEDGADIYYTMDQTYPSPTNGTLYTEPLEFEDDYFTVRAVAYKDGKRSNYVKKQIHSATLGTADMFKVTDDGAITEYHGNVQYLKIPEEINGIKIVDIADGLFSQSKLYGIILPDTLEYLGYTATLYDRPLQHGTNPFYGNSTIQFVSGKNVKIVGVNGMYGLLALREVDFPNCEEIEINGFRNTMMRGAIFPKVKSVGAQAFMDSNYLRELYLPTCEEVGYSAFYNTPVLWRLHLPNANYQEYDYYNNLTYSVDDSDATRELFNGTTQLMALNLQELEIIGSNAFYNSLIKRLELSNISYIYDIPNTMRYDTANSHYCECFYPVDVELILPATLRYCIPATDHKKECIEYVVYGTAGINSYAEQWAMENNIEFVNISQETAIVEDIEPIWDKYSYKPLEFDARGFNRTYQWYGSYDNKMGNDILLKGYTDKTFNPNDSKPYPYYYCVMTSTDKDIDDKVVSEVTVTSSMCENRLYYMFALPDTHINFDNNLIYTKIKACTNYSEIIGFKDTTNYYVIPSYVYRNSYWYGTGSEILLYTGNQRESYTLIVEGDINGDSAVDVLDASQVAMVSAGLKDIDGVYKLAADSNLDDVVDVVDYQAVVNMVVA